MSFLLEGQLSLSWGKCNKKFRDNYGDAKRRYECFVSVCSVCINLWINHEHTEYERIASSQ
jgi:hypothetical protein